jgi:hypothetical protein
MSHSSSHKNDTHGTHAEAKGDAHAGSTQATPKAGAKAAAPRDAAADQLKLLLLLSTDWLNGDRTHSAEIATLTASLAGAQGAPVNVDVPYVSQTGATLFCTMGNWSGEPVSYAYAWDMDGVAAGGTDPTYAVQPGDVGKSATCAVTATNALGSTAAPMSNAVTVA